MNRFVGLSAVTSLATCAVATPAVALADGPPPGESVWLARGGVSEVSVAYYVRRGTSLRMLWVGGQEWGCNWGAISSDRAKMRSDRGGKYVTQFDRSGAVMSTRSKSVGSKWSPWTRSKRTTATKANDAVNAPFDTDVRIKKLYRRCTWQQPAT